jgi:hypothetical protein
MHGDRKIGGQIGVNVPLQDTASKTRHADHRMMRRMIVRKALRPDEHEGLVAGTRRVGVDVIEVDEIALGVAVAEDRVGRRHGRVDCLLKDEAVGAGTAKEPVLTEAADEDIVAGKSLEDVVAG